MESLLQFSSFQIGPKSVNYKILTSPSTGLKIARSDLELQLEPHHFRDGLLNAKCVASMLTNHWQSTDIYIKEESPTLASVVDHSNGVKNVTADTSSEANSAAAKSATSKKVGGGFDISTVTSSSSFSTHQFAKGKIKIQ